MLRPSLSEHCYTALQILRTQLSSLRSALTLSQYISHTNSRCCVCCSTWHCEQLLVALTNSCSSAQALSAHEPCLECTHLTSPTTQHITKCIAMQCNAIHSCPEMFYLAHSLQLPTTRKCFLKRKKLYILQQQEKETKESSPVRWNENGITLLAKEERQQLLTKYLPELKTANLTTDNVSDVILHSSKIRSVYNR